MYLSNSWKNFRLLVCAPANQETKWRKMTANLNCLFAMNRRYFNVNTGNAIKSFDAGGLKVMQAVHKKNIINFFGLNVFR